VRQVQRQDDTGLREHRIRGTFPQQARMIPGIRLYKVVKQ
jgi:hypothetical protein